MRLILTLALLLMAGTAWAGPEFLTMIGPTCSTQTGTVDTINGINGFADGGDTSTATMSAVPLCSGTASISATCDGTLGGSATVALVTVSNGVTTTASLSCSNGEAQKTQTLTAAVAGTYTARVYSSGSGYAAADTFVFPIAQ